MGPSVVLFMEINLSYRVQKPVHVLCIYSVHVRTCILSTCTESCPGCIYMYIFASACLSCKSLSLDYRVIGGLITPV